MIIQQKEKDANADCKKTFCYSIIDDFGKLHIGNITSSVGRAIDNRRRKLKRLVEAGLIHKNSSKNTDVISADYRIKRTEVKLGIRNGRDLFDEE